MKELKLPYWRFFFICSLMSLSLMSWGQEIELDPVTGTYAITNATVVQAPGRVMNEATVLVENGVIKSVGKSVTIPANARILQADSMYVYAGFIDGLSHTGIPKPKEVRVDRSKIKDPGNPPNDVAGIQPERQASTMIKPGHKSVTDMRKIGFTLSHVVPHGRMLPGQGSMVLLTGETPDEMIYKNNTSMFSQLSGAPRRIYPNTVIGVMAKYRELYRQATQSKNYLNRYNANPTGMVRPQQNYVVEAFHPVLDKKLPIAFKAESVMDIQRVLTLQSDLGFNLLLGEVKQGWDVMDEIIASRAKVFLSLNMPEIKEKKSDSTQTDEKIKKTSFDLEKEALENRKKEIIDFHYSQASAFKKAGIKFGFSTLEVESKDIRKNLVKLKEYGMQESDLLAALTTHPAELLGLSNVMGSVDTGKMANLIIADNPYFEEDTNVKYVFVSGHLYEFEVKKKKKEDKGEESKK